MSRYIDADLLKAEFTGNFTQAYATSLIKRIIDQQPNADVQEVKHGKWIPSKKQYGMVICSNCHRGFCCDWIHYKYCYECGAKMDLEDNE